MLCNKEDIQQSRPKTGESLKTDSHTFSNKSKYSNCQLKLAKECVEKNNSRSVRDGF